MIVALAWGANPAAAAMSAAAVVVLAGAARPRTALQHVDWSLLLLFGGLFVVMRGVEQAGLAHAVVLRIAADDLHLADGEALARLGVAVTVLSQAVSNVPAVMLFVPTLESLGQGADGLWLGLAAFSTLAGNLTIIGSVASVIVFELARREGVEVGFFDANGPGSQSRCPDGIVRRSGEVPPGPGRSIPATGTAMNDRISESDVAPPHDHPRVVIFPPLLFLIVVITVAGLQWILPIPWPLFGISRWVGGLLALAGLALVTWARTCFSRAETNVSPRRSSTTIVMHGPYRFSRNPMYIAMIITLAGVAFGLRWVWGLALIPVLWLMLHFGVIAREEAYLEAKFAEAYRDYRQRVRRWV